jgi:hypothetical protein
MAQILMIAPASLSLADNRQENDIVGIYPDDHVFSDHEKAVFKIVQVKDVSRDAISQDLSAKTEVREATRAKTTDWTIEEPERARVWRDGNDWKEIKVEPRFHARYEDGQIKENFSRYVENTVPLILGSATKES